MKKFVSTMVAGAAVLAIAGSASAQTVTLRITGSTAFRSATHNSIIAMMSSNLVYGYGGASLGSAGTAQFQGYVGATPVDIKTSWAGSVGGIQSLVQNRTDGSNAKWLNQGPALTPGGTANLTAVYDAPHVADIAMSDTFQGITPYTSPALTEQKVGVVPFVWVRNTGGPAAVNNMTTLQAQLLLAAGQLPVGLWTGSTNDTEIVTIIGRDEDSGTRVVTFEEPAFGWASFPQQWQAGILQGGSNNWGAAGGISSTIGTGGLRLMPPNTVLGVSYGDGHSGYSSGGTLANVLATPGAFANAGSHIIGYVGLSDAQTATNSNSGALIMKYNGQDYSPDAVRSGKYTFWSYEHLMYRSSFSGTAKTVADTLANTIKTANIAPAGINLSTMGVSRVYEGGAVSP